METLGYMITWTTYGTWLQGDERGYVKKGQTLAANEALEQTNKKLQSQNAVRLSKAQQQIVRTAITKQAQLQGHHMYALVVQSNHVHVVIKYSPEPISRIVAHYKNAARVALKVMGHSGKLWTKGYDKRFCFDKEALEQRIKYVERHTPI
jgi:REP element-mobilizing transposase RayT